MVHTLNFNHPFHALIVAGMETNEDEADLNESLCWRSLEGKIDYLHKHIADLEEQLAACRKRYDEAAELTVIAPLRLARARLAECLAQQDGRN